MKFCALVLTTVAATTVHLGDAGADGKAKVRTKTVEIMDDAFGIVAYRMQIPEDWKFEGVLLRDQSCGLVPGVALRATSPDGLTGYQILPQFGWHWSDSPIYLKAFRDHHCKLMEAMTPSEFLQYVAPAIRPQPTLGPIEPTVDAKQMADSIAQFNARNAQAHLPGKESGGGVHSLIEYTLHGEVVTENLRVVVNQFDSPAGPGRSSMTATANVIGLRAPKARYAEASASLYPIFVTGSYTEEWMKRQLAKMANDSARVMAIIRKQGDDAMAMIRKQGADNAATMKRNHDAYTAETQRGYASHNQAEAARQDAVHRSAAAWTLYAGDEQLVRNPQTGAVSRVTNQAGTHGHQDSVSGDIIMTTDPSFDPNAYIRGNWTQLENVNP